MKSIQIAMTYINEIKNVEIFKLVLDSCSHIDDPRTILKVFSKKFLRMDIFEWDLSRSNFYLNRVLILQTDRFSFKRNFQDWTHDNVPRTIIIE